MSKKVKALIAVLILVLLLTVGATATVLAEGEEETTPLAEEAGTNGLLQRVADILGIDQEDLVNAFKQARQEMCEEAFIDRLNQAVEEGLITQEQADEILEWWLERPDDAIEAWQGQGPNARIRGMFKHALRSHVSSRFHIQNGPGVGFCPRLPEEAD